MHLLIQTQIIGNKHVVSIAYVDYKEHHMGLEMVRLLQIEKCLLNIYECWGPFGEMSPLTKHTKVVCGLEHKLKYKELVQHGVTTLSFLMEMRLESSGVRSCLPLYPLCI